MAVPLAYLRKVSGRLQEHAQQSCHAALCICIVGRGDVDVQLEQIQGRRFCGRGLRHLLFMGLNPAPEHGFHQSFLRPEAGLDAPFGDARCLRNGIDRQRTRAMLADDPGTGVGAEPASRARPARWVRSPGRPLARSPSLGRTVGFP